MKNAVRAMALALISLPLSFGRVGETEAGLEKLFGPPVLRSDDATIAQGKIIPLGPKLSYRQNDWRITCDIVDGRCVRSSYSKQGEWTVEQVSTVLTVNAQGAKWTETSPPSVRKFKREWKRDDGATAVWGGPIGGMTVTTPAYERAKKLAEAKAKAEASRVPKL